MEQWLPITHINRFLYNGGPIRDTLDFTGMGYSISSEGRLMNTNGKLLTSKPSKSSQKKFVIENNLTDINGKIYKIQRHQLVIQTFKQSEYFDCASILHVDNDKTNNSIENLEWIAVSKS